MAGEKREGDLGVSEYDLAALTFAARAQGALEARFGLPSDLVFDPRAGLKCRFGCPRWGRYWTCPPHVGVSREEFRETLPLYSRLMVIMSLDQAVGQQAALAAEREAMRRGLTYSLALALCVACPECSWPEPCVKPAEARPPADALGVDIARSVEPLGFEVRFDPEGKLVPAWYTMVLLG